MMNVLLYVVNLGLLISGGVATDDRKALRCKNPAGKLWSSILNRNCGQSVCKKSGNKAKWKECPKAATEEILKELIENQTKKLDEKIEMEKQNLKEVIESQTKKMQEVMENELMKIKENLLQNCGKEPVEMTTSGAGSTETPTTAGLSVQDDGIIFIGPSRSSRESQLFLYPSLRKAACRPPTFPYGNNPDGYSGYVTRKTDDGLQFCGGSVNSGVSTKRCFLLTRDGSWTETSPLPSGVRQIVYPHSSSVDFAEGWWIAGFSADTGATILWDGTAWQNYVNLPKALERFCMTKINSTHVFLSGGKVYNSGGGIGSTESYIYSHATGFVQIANMARARGDHACGVLNERYVVVVAGGGGRESEYFSLETMTWSEGPTVDYGSNPWMHKIVTQGNKMYLITDKSIFTLENADNDDANEWEWVKSADLEIEGYNKDVFLMDTEDCEDWNV